MIDQSEDVSSHEPPIPVQSALNVIASAALLNAVKRIPSFLWILPPEELERRCEPTKVAIDLRDAFWRLVEKSLGPKGKKIQLAELAVEARCSYAHAYELLTSKPETLAWVLTPAIDLAEESVHLLPLVAEQMRKILDLPIEDGEGRVLVQNVKAQIKVFELLDDRYRPRGR